MLFSVKVKQPGLMEVPADQFCEGPFHVNEFMIMQSDDNNRERVS